MEIPNKELIKDMCLVLDEWTGDDISKLTASRMKKKILKMGKQGRLNLKIDAQMKWRLCAARLQRANFKQPWLWMDFQYRSEWALNHHKWGDQWRPQAGIHTPWKGSEHGRDWNLRVLAEQGIGDEILFGSVFEELFLDCGTANVELDDRLISVFRRSFPRRNFTSRWILGDDQRQPPSPEDYNKIGFDAYICAADVLPRYRTCFAPPGTPYLQADKSMVNTYRLLLSDIGPPPYIGLSWKGGRSLLDPKLLKKEEGTYISLQYKRLDFTGHAHMIGSDEGPDWVNYVPVDHNNMEEVFALCEALDYINTVQCYIVHVCGSIGKKCNAVKPVPQFGAVGADESENNRLKWNYGTGGKHPWYNSVKVFRNWQEFQASKP